MIISDLSLSILRESYIFQFFWLETTYITETNMKYKWTYCHVNLFNGIWTQHCNIWIAKIQEWEDNGSSKTLNSEYITLDQPHDLKFSPILGGHKCPKSSLRHLWNTILIRDDLDFLCHLPEEVENDCILYPAWSSIRSYRILD